jgi:transcriptional regulator with GAF, ATPase, and Fis domain
MSARLVIISGPLAGATLQLADPEQTIGRNETNRIALADPGVSPIHCAITRTDLGLLLKDFDATNPTFVNGLPAGDRILSNGDQIQIGNSLLVFSDTTPERGDANHRASISHTGTLPPLSIVMSREDLVTGGPSAPDSAEEPTSRDLHALIRISGTINAVRGLVALERPLLELLADVIPASRGAVLLSGERYSEITSTTGWSRLPHSERPVQISQPLIDRVLRDAVGILSRLGVEDDDAGSSPRAGRSVMAAPLVAFDQRIGAILLEQDDFEPPFDEGHLRLLMAIAGMAATALQHARQVAMLEGANRMLQAQLNLEHNMVGESPAMREVFRRISRVAPTDSTVLITGESGTGKELVARAIHRNSRRADRPFVAINSAAITPTLLESELFGHERGAFTGAVAQKKGKLEAADGGTVFLDEIGELSLELQAKLLRVLEDHQFDRVGGTRSVRVDFRLIAATNRNLELAISESLFRRDLYYRLKVVSLAMPALKDRREDIPLLANWFVRRHADKARRTIAGFSPDALACLNAYEWPGNVRELENAVEHAVVLGFDPLILRDDLPEAVTDAGASLQAAAGRGLPLFHEAVTQAKKDLIVRAVEDARGNYSMAARALGLHPNYLHRLIRNLQLKAALRHLS